MKVLGWILVVTVVVELKEINAGTALVFLLWGGSQLVAGGHAFSVPLW